MITSGAFRRIRGVPDTPLDLTWTQRLATGAALVGLYVAIQVDWFGMAEGAHNNVVAQAAWVALVGYYAMRVAALGLSVGLFLAVFVLFLDQLTVAVGVLAAPTGLPDDYWISNTARVAVVLALYPWIVRVASRSLRSPLRLALLPLALVPLPFLRLFDAPELVVDALRSGTGGIILPVPWVPLILTVAAAVVFVALADTWLTSTAKSRTLVVTTLVLTLFVPGASALRDGYERSVGVVVEPATSGPLDVLELQASFPGTFGGVAIWDGHDAIQADGAPVRAHGRRGVVTAFVVAALQPAFETGTHRIGLRSGDSSREVTYQVALPKALDVSVESGYLVVRDGRSGERLSLLIVGPEGPEQFSAQLDAGGGWRSSSMLPDGRFRVVAQTPSAWGVLGCGEPCR